MNGLTRCPSEKAIMLRAIWLAAALVVLVGGIVLEFVVDIRTPRSGLAMRSALVTHNKLPPETLAAAAVKLKAKFGEDATVWQGPTGIYVRRDGDILAIEPAKTFFHEALGITQVVDTVGAIATFPFHVSPYELRDSAYPQLVPSLMMRVAPAFTPGNLDFDAADFSIDHCRSVAPRELRLTLANRILRLSPSTLCTVTWKREPARRMLIGIVAADGGRWIRPFTRSACRVLSNAWLANARKIDAGQPNYLQCLLVDRRKNQPFGSGVSSFAYEVRKDGSLARFYSTPRGLEEAPLGPDPRVPTRTAENSGQRRTDVVPLKPDARLPTFHRVDPNEPPKAREPEGGKDPARDALAASLIQAANRLNDAPCDEARKARYIAAAVKYAQAWLELMPCFEKNNCSYEDNLHNEKITKTIGKPWRHDVMEIAEKVHLVVAFRESDFPKKVQRFMANIGSDPSINPDADPRFKDSSIRAMMRRDLVPGGCVTSNLR
jgi:hypothetical protein